MHNKEYYFSLPWWHDINAEPSIEPPPRSRSQKDPPNTGQVCSLEEMSSRESKGDNKENSRDGGKRSNTH